MRAALRPQPSAITTVDCRYMNKPNYAAAYMLQHGREVAFVDNNTNEQVSNLLFSHNSSIPYLLSALKQNNLSWQDVKYIIVTHIHLDHSGGTSQLSKLCPNARVLAHPRAAPHLIDPSRIIAGARSVYGEQKFAELYGEIEPIESDRVVHVEDGTKLQLGDSELEFIHTRGHARHHMVIYDKNTKSIFTGDSFGVSYLPLMQQLGARQGVIFPSSSPIDFEPQEAHKSVDKIVATGAERAYPTHFGVWDDMTRGAELLHAGISHFEGILQETKVRISEGMNDEDLQSWGESRQRLFFDTLLENDGIDVAKHKEALWDILHYDIELNAAGIIVAARRELRSKRENE